MRFRSWMAATAAMLAGTPALGQTNLNMSNWISPQAPFVLEALVPWSKQVEEVTQGRVRVRMLPKAVSSPTQHFDAVRDGLADVTFIVHGYTPGRFVMTKAAELPFFGDSAEATSVAYNRIHERMLARANEHQGVRLLAVFTNGPGHFFLSRRPVEKLQDLSGMKFRTGGGIVDDVAAALGIVGLLKPATDVYEMMSSGVADGVFFTRQSILTFKLGTVVKHALIVPDGAFSTSFALIMNEDRFSKLSQADRDAIQKISGDAFARLAGQSFDRSDVKGEALLRENKATITTASPAFTADLRKALQPVVDAWIKEASAKGVDGRAAVDAMRAEAKKLAPK